MTATEEPTTVNGVCCREVGMKGAAFSAGLLGCCCCCCCMEKKYLAFCGVWFSCFGIDGSWGLYMFQLFNQRSRVRSLQVDLRRWVLYSSASVIVNVCV